MKEDSHSEMMIHLSLCRYKFRIKVENAYGISDASEESDAFDVGGVQIQQDTRWALDVLFYLIAAVQRLLHAMLTCFFLFLNVDFHFYLFFSLMFLVFCCTRRFPLPPSVYQTRTCPPVRGGRPGEKCRAAVVAYSFVVKDR